MERELRREAEALYALPPGEFTRARNARAKELRRDDADLAAQVATLPKPTAAAAAINRIAREEPSEVRALVQAGRALRSAHEAAVAGGSSTAVAGATREHREALERVRREARRLGLSAAVFDRVTATLRAASVEPELQPLLERGLLAREEQASGFGLDPGLVSAAAPAAPRRTRKPKPEEAARRRTEARAELKEARERLAAAKRALAAAERERARVERELAAAERQVKDADAEVAAAEQAVDEAKSAVDGARSPRSRDEADGKRRG